MAIPKVIHYCWFGGKKKPKLVLNCIESWRNLLPDFEIKEWNETNSDLSGAFVNEVYRLKKWAFVSDYVRLEVLFKHGGIYLDTDMLLIKDISTFLKYDLFLGAEESRFISCGIIGIIPNHPFLKVCLNSYKNLSLKEIKFREITIPKILTYNFKEYYNFNDKFNDLIIIKNVLICPKNYFYPFSCDDSEKEKNYLDFIVEETYAVHLWHKSWIEFSEFYFIKKGYYLKGGQVMFKNLFTGKETFNIKYLKKIGYSLKKSINK